MNNLNSNECRLDIRLVRAGLSIEEACFIQVILDNEKRNDEWVLFSFGFLHSLWSLTRRVQDRIIKSLKAKKLIKTSLRGAPPIRFAKVDKKKLLTYIEPNS